MTGGPGDDAIDDTLNQADGADLADAPGPVVTLGVHGGEGQTAVVGTAVEDVPTVKVTDAEGNPLPGILVRFEIVAGDGSLEGADVTTNKDGLAWVAKWTLGNLVGLNRIKASAGTSTVEFSATAIPGPAAAIAQQGGNTPLNAPVDSETELVSRISTCASWRPRHPGGGVSSIVPVGL